MEKLNGSHSRMITGIIFLLAVFVITNSCKKSPADVQVINDTPGPNEVIIQGMAFNPSAITVSAGTTITWTNKDGVAHTVTSDTGLFDSGSLGSNETYSRTFSTAGTFPYHCTIHPFMKGSVIVN